MEPEREDRQQFEVGAERVAPRRERADLQRTSGCPATVIGCPTVQTVTLNDPIDLADLRRMAASGFGDFVKAVVDVEQDLMVVDAEMHSDQEAALIAAGSRQRDLWGINLYPELSEDEWVEFDSMINLRPSSGNRSRSVDDPATRERIRDAVGRLVRR